MLEYERLTPPVKFRRNIYCVDDFLPFQIGMGLVETQAYQKRYGHSVCVHVGDNITTGCW